MKAFASTTFLLQGLSWGFRFGPACRRIYNIMEVVEMRKVIHSVIFLYKLRKYHKSENNSIRTEGQSSSNMCSLHVIRSCCLDSRLFFFFIAKFGT